MTLEPGQTLAHYRIERLIGQGGMGAVFLAEDTRLHRKVALKVLPEEMAANADRLARFQREAQAVAALNHPHIVTIYSVEEAGGTHFLTMELVEGASLDNALAAGGLALARVFDIGIALADALGAAHEKGIVHRDLKPANIMLTKDGRVKVLDFGLAKLALESSAGASATGGPGASEALTQESPRDRPLTDAGMVVGTVPYMSPEQVGGETVDARSDIFSLGIVLYEMATGRRPFQGKNKAETISSILRDTPRPVSEARQDAPRHLGRILNHCLQKEPRDRYQTARDVYNELRALRKEMESEASAASHPAATAGTDSVAHGAAAVSGRTSGPVSGPASGPVSAPVATMSGAASGFTGARPWIGVVGGGVLLTLVGVAFWLGGRRAPAAGSADSAATAPVAGTHAGAPAVTETNSLAVLPFADLSAAKDQEYFSDGLTEELLNALVKIPDLKVAGRTSSFSFKGKNEDLRSIGEKLGVANILEGSVRKSGNKVRITAQLVKASDGFHLWSETYDRTLDDIFAVQDDIARAVAQALQVTLLGQRANAKRPDAEAYDLVLQARYIMAAATAGRIQQARETLERALKLSPEYAPAWAEMGLLHTRELMRATNQQEGRQVLDRARSALTRALQLDPELAIAHSRMAAVQQFDFEFAEAERSTARALAAAPKDPGIMGNAAIIYANLGRLTEAIRLTEQANEIDPLTPNRYLNLASYFSTLGRLDDAEQACRRGIELLPDEPTLHLTAGIISLQRGQAEPARPSFKTYTELSGLGDYARLQGEALIEHTAGNATASRTATEEFERRFGEDDPYMAASIRAWRSEADAAFAWLDKCVSNRYPGLVQLKTDVLFNPLHSDPRWLPLLKKIGFTAEPVR